MNVKGERKKIINTYSLSTQPANRANRPWAVWRIDYLFIYTNF